MVSFVGGFLAGASCALAVLLVMAGLRYWLIQRRLRRRHREDDQQKFDPEGY